jgi:DNA-binding CsgD family transcriptional regulator
MPDYSRRLLRSLPILVTTHAADGQGTYTGVYTGLQVKSHASPKELVGEALADVLNPEATATLLDAFAEASGMGTRQYVEFPVHFGDETFWRGSYVSPFPADGEGSDDPEEVIVAGFDLTRHDEREQALYDVFDALESHTARRDLERAFCARLVDGRRYELAWIGTADHADEPIVRASAGADGYLSDLRDAVGSLEGTADPGVRALQSAEPVSVHAVDASDGDWATAAAAHDLQAAVAIPLVHEGIEHGVLAVYLADSEYLVSWREDVLVDYADAVGYALSAAMWQWALAADVAARLTVHVGDGHPLLELCDAADRSALTAVSAVPRPEGTVYYLRDDGDDLTAAAERCDGLTSYGVRGTPAVVAETTTPEGRLVRLGARIRTVRVATRSAAVDLTVPSSETVRRVREVLKAECPNATITVRWGADDAHDDDAPVRSVGRVLTDRQYEMLEAAYRHGYFDRNRNCNLSELAAALDLSRWTVSEHLRLAQRRLCSHLLDG